MTISIGETVEAEVLRVEHYGLYLKYQASEIIVLIPDVSNTPVRDLTLLYEPGDHVSVKVVEYVASRSLFKGTIKDR